MRKPSEYLPAALKGLRGRLMPDCSETLRHGERSATVTRVGSISRGEDALTGSDVNEGVRVLASASDFPTLERGEAVELGGSLRVVTSLRSDPVGASLSVGLSAAFGECPAAFSGRRASASSSSARTIAFTLDALALEDAAAPSAPGDPLGPSGGRTWTVCVRAADWPETEPPQTGDEIRIVAPGDGRELRLRAASVSRGGGWWTIRARPRGSQW